MAGRARTTQFRFWLWVITLIGVIVPRRLRADWRQEWEAELRRCAPRTGNLILQIDPLVALRHE